MSATRRSNRQDAIRWIVRNRSIRTQKSLVEELRKEGFSCTQATASRDIADMGMHKLSDGIYVLGEDLHLQRLIAEFVTGVESVNNLTVIKARPGTGPGIATALESADLPGVVGSVAGNDSVLVITRTKEGAGVVRQLISKLSSRGIEDEVSTVVVPEIEELEEDEEDYDEE